MRPFPQLSYIKAKWFLTENDFLIQRKVPSRILLNVEKAVGKSETIVREK